MFEIREPPAYDGKSDEANCEVIPTCKPDRRLQKANDNVQECYARQNGHYPVIELVQAHFFRFIDDPPEWQPILRHRTLPGRQRCVLTIYNGSAMTPEQDRRVLHDRRHVRKVCKAVFPAAGLGTRFLPATKAQPKEMLPLVDKPIIQYGVEEAMAAGCDQIIIITGRGKSAIEDHFDVSYELEKMLEEKGKNDLLQIVRQISDMMYVSYVRQKEALGLGHAILTARELVGHEPFAALLADDVIDAKVPVLKQLMDVFNEKQQSVIAIQPVDGPAISSYGVIKGKEVAGSGGKLFEVLDLVEKPPLAEAPSNLAVIGRYILTPTIFETLSNIKPGAGGELQLTDGLRALLKREKLYGCVYEGRRHDTGDKLGFLKATVEFALKRNDLGGPFREYLKGLKI